jgi:hypothetical protein
MVLSSILKIIVDNLFQFTVLYNNKCCGSESAKIRIILNEPYPQRPSGNLIRIQPVTVDYIFAEPLAEGTVRKYDGQHRAQLRRRVGGWVDE